MQLFADIWFLAGSWMFSIGLTVSTVMRWYAV
jgi:hypothetical protein